MARRTQEGDTLTASGPEPEEDQNDVPEPDAQEQSKEEFEQSQRALAESQNLTAPNAVPEQRPIASQQVVDTESELTRRLRDEDYLNEEPMDFEAYERAGSDSQRESAAEDERHEQIKVADVVRVTAGPHRGREVAVTRIEAYQNPVDFALRQQGTPEQRFIQPKRIEGRARGDERDGEILILDVEDDGLEVIRNWRGTGRG